MSSRKELEQELDKLPPKPYKLTADLREMHRLFHEASKIDEGIPCLIQHLETEEKMIEFVDSIKSTNLGKALELTDDIAHDVFENGCPEGSTSVLKLNLRIYSEHNPPSDINHHY